MEGGGYCQLWTKRGKLLADVGVAEMVRRRVYVPSHDAPAVHHINQALEVAPKGMELILLGDINVRLS